MKKIIVVACVSVAATFIGYNAIHQKRCTNISNIMLANVEALANDKESSGGGCKLNLISICETSHKDHYFYRNK